PGFWLAGLGGAFRFACCRVCGGGGWSAGGGWAGGGEAWAWARARAGQRASVRMLALAQASRRAACDDLDMDLPSVRPAVRKASGRQPRRVSLVGKRPLLRKVLPPSGQPRIRGSRAPRQGLGEPRSPSFWRCCRFAARAAAAVDVVVMRP